LVSCIGLALACVWLYEGPGRRLGLWDVGAVLNLLLDLGDLLVDLLVHLEEGHLNVAPDGDQLHVETLVLDDQLLEPLIHVLQAIVEVLDLGQLRILEAVYEGLGVVDPRLLRCLVAVYLPRNLLRALGVDSLAQVGKILALSVSVSLYGVIYDLGWAHEGHDASEELVEEVVELILGYALRSLGVCKSEYEDYVLDEELEGAVDGDEDAADQLEGVDLVDLAIVEVLEDLLEGLDLVTEDLHVKVGVEDEGDGGRASLSDLYHHLLKCLLLPT